jgi:hypothetical protein
LPIECAGAIYQVTALATHAKRFLPVTAMGRIFGTRLAESSHEPCLKHQTRSNLGSAIAHLLFVV